MGNQALKNIEHLRDKKDFDALFVNGIRRRGKHLSIQVLHRYGQDQRVAFIASKRVGNAVQRNRAKRLMREAFRITQDNCPENADMAFIADKKILSGDIHTVKAEIVRLVSRESSETHA